MTATASVTSTGSAIGFAKIAPVFGDELDSYTALIYGIQGVPESGVPAGLFWDLRTIPLPYTPRKPTVFRVNVYENNIGKLHRIKFVRENPTVIPTTDYYDFVPETSESHLQLYLGKGLNVLDMYVIDGAESRIYTAEYTATTFATILHGHATMITRYGWRPLRDLQTQLLGPRSTGLLEPLFGKMSDLFAKPMLLNTLAKQLAINVLTYGSDNQSVVDLGAGFYQQTPLLQQPLALGFDELFRYQYLQEQFTFSQQWNQKRYHTWALNPSQAKKALAARYLSNIQVLEAASPSTLTTADLEVIHYHDDYEPIVDSHTEEWSLFVVSVLPVPVEPHTRHHDEVVFPGLWDNGVMPYFDTDTELDTGTFDSADVSGDIVLDGFIGTTLFNEQSNDLGVTLLDRLVETTDVHVGLFVGSELTVEP